MSEWEMLEYIRAWAITNSSPRGRVRLDELQHQLNLMQEKFPHWGYDSPLETL